AEKAIREVAPNIKVEMIDEWEKPQEAMERKSLWLIVNAKPIRALFAGKEKLNEEITAYKPFLDQNLKPYSEIVRKS
ncbi:hypothetical protein KAU30_03405, partial [Candidatus Bathyarchaeota archaeon]|nr:hypothetical protein [Candidatus Bathyarchaeota archaeon]